MKMLRSVEGCFYKTSLMMALW